MSVAEYIRGYLGISIVLLVWGVCFLQAVRNHLKGRHRLYKAWKSRRAIVEGASFSEFLRNRELLMAKYRYGP